MLTDTATLVCLYPGCTYLTASEDQLHDHYPFHFGPIPTLPSGQDGQSAYYHRQLLLDGSPTIVDDQSFVEYVIQYLAEGHRELVFDISQSLFRKFCQAFLDGLSTKEGTLLLNPRGHLGSAKAFILRVHLTQRGLSLRLRYRHAHPTHNCNLELHWKYGLSPTTPGESRFAWLPILTGAQSLCKCINCLTKTLEPLGFFSGLKRDIRWLSYQSNLYHCDIVGCSHKSKRWGDLERHILARHCSETAKYPCSFPGCERGGGNGFPRKDKLKSHFENVHRGRGIRPKQRRALAPK